MLLIYESLKLLSYLIVKSAILWEKLEECFIRLKENNTVSNNDVYFDAASYWLNYLKPYSVSKTKSKLKTVEIEDPIKSNLMWHINNFRLMYSILLAYQDVLKLVSKDISIDVSYKVDEHINNLKEKAGEHNNILNIMLVDFNLEKEIEDIIESDHDKELKTREGIYLDLHTVKADEATFNESIKRFESYLGKDFWKM